MELGQTIVLSMVTLVVIVATVGAVRKYLFKLKIHHNH